MTVLPAGEEQQEYLISTMESEQRDCVYVITASLNGSRLEVTIEDGNLTSLLAYDSRLCRNVQVTYRTCT